MDRWNYTQVLRSTHSDAAKVAKFCLEGNYPLLDLQQLHTGLIDRDRISQKVLATVISFYPERGENRSDEAMCDAGGIALSKDTGPSGGHGEVIGKAWRLSKVSQEHGVLTRTRPPLIGEGLVNDPEASLEVGDVIEIVGQHACMIAAAHPWYYIVDSDMDESCNMVVDVWVPWKGW
jgi:D-serine ammonia-lyase